MAEAGQHQFTDIKLEIKGQVGIIKFNRPKSLNSLGGNLILDVITAVRALNEHPDTVFTVLTGEGRFFCSGADVLTQENRVEPVRTSKAAIKVAYVTKFAGTTELVRSLICHTKVLLVALNGPAVGAGAAWFLGVADVVLASETSYLQTPFSQLGLVPEFGSAPNFSQSIGVHRSNDFFLFGRKCTAEEMLQWGMVNRIFPVNNFHSQVEKFLEDQLAVNDGKSMMEAKRLQNRPLINQRLLALYEAADALAERFVEDAPRKRFQKQAEMLRAKRKANSSKAKI